MQLFLKKTGWIILLLASLLLIIFLCNKIIFSYSSKFDIAEDISTLILGDSHVKYAFNDKIITGSYNLSANADSYFYSYLKLKAVHARNEHIDTLLLSFATHNLSHSIEDRWLLNTSNLNSRLNLYYPLFDVTDLMFLLKNVPIDLIGNLFDQVLFPLNYFKEGLDAYGGYKDLEHNILSSEIEKQERELDGVEDVFLISSIEKKYLLRIKNYCLNKGIKLILVNCPLHKSQHNTQEALYNSYSEYFSDILFLDFSKLEMKDSYFGDLVHLSSNGAKYFSKQVESNGIINFANITNSRY